MRLLRRPGGPGAPLSGAPRLEAEGRRAENQTPRTLSCGTPFIQRAFSAQLVRERRAGTSPQGGPMGHSPTSMRVAWEGSSALAASSPSRLSWPVSLAQLPTAVNKPSLSASTQALEQLQQEGQGGQGGPEGQLEAL